MKLYSCSTQPADVHEGIPLLSKILHAHLQVVYYKCVKFHKNPISGLGGVALTRYMDRWTDGQGDSYIPPSRWIAEDIKICVVSNFINTGHFFGWGVILVFFI
jgi:hypothetical protein